MGVDGVLVGLWSSLPKEGVILDVGCGCGVISLILAQRCSERPNYYYIESIDIDRPSVLEASENFALSPWNEHMVVRELSFDDLVSPYKYSLIVSNPPYFDSGVTGPSTRREKARHCGGLSPEALIIRAPELLTDEGLLAMIVPSEHVEHLKDLAEENGLFLNRLTFVKGHRDAPVKRALLEFGRTAGVPEEDILVLEEEAGVPTEEYRAMGKDFYLYF